MQVIVFIQSSISLFILPLSLLFLLFLIFHERLAHLYRYLTAGSVWKLVREIIPMQVIP
jgi:hypothetical protein